MPTLASASSAAAATLGCGASRAAARALPGRPVADLISVACIVLYVITLLLDPAGALRARGGVTDILPVSQAAELAAGATGAVPWQAGAWWTLLTAIYLHGNLVHLVFNIISVRVLAPPVEEHSPRREPWSSSPSPA
jgi:membrane associated rhomboid family serine protease